MPELEILPQYTTRAIPMDQIYSDENFNCRGRIIPMEVADLARSIREDKLQVPITVQPYNHPGDSNIQYRIVAGHRRHMAYRINKETAIPAMIRTDLDEFQARLFNLTENLKRQDLNILQEARALLPFKKGGWTEELIAAKTGTSRGWVQVRMMLLSMPDDIQAEAAAGILNQTHIRNLYSMKSNEERYAAIRLLKDRQQKGEHAVIPAKMDVKPFEKKERKKEDLIGLQEYVQDEVGNNIVTRILGWTLGYVNNIEIHTDLRNFFEKEGVKYRIPKGLIAKI